MTDAEKDAAWRSLPEVDKAAYRRIYHREANAGVESYGRGYRDALADAFGKHNLTASEEPIQDKTMNKEKLLKSRKERGKQTLNIGDKVRAISASGKPLYDGNVATIIEKGMSGDEVYYGLSIEGVAVEKRSTPLIGKPEIIGNTSLLAPFFAEDLELVASRAEEEKPRFKVGDCVVIAKYFSNTYQVGAICLVMEVRISHLGWHAYRLDRAKDVWVDEHYLAPYTEEQEPKEVNKVRKINVGDIVRVKRETPSSLYNNMPYAFVDMPFFVTEIEVDCDNNLNDTAHLRNGSTYLNIHPHWLQKEDIHHKWETKDGRQEVVDMTLKTWLNSTPDWLAYRMELAKEVTPKVISALSDGGVSSNFCMSVIDKVTTIVDGIVERLKGGEK